MPYPLTGELFTLTINPFSAVTMATTNEQLTRSFPGKWQFNGQEIEREETKFFKLHTLDGSFPDLFVFRNSLAPTGEIPHGQWLIPFKIKYPESNRKNAIAIADASWINPNGFLYFPMIMPDGRLTFRPAGVKLNSELSILWVIGVNP